MCGCDDALANRRRVGRSDRFVDPATRLLGRLAGVEGPGAHAASQILQSFFAKMARAGVVKPSLDISRGYTLQFVNKRVGIDLRPKK